ncbi:type III secretion system translocator chaperone SicA [Burkholderia alba]|uniref:type III secretion system translocator chaperone SicA n=1 Tax=Burkholderia alba TaxID=2683677 RepID=UPI002B052DC7|nr:type III secretion system translocator chaperone SicA [Burkholderia alba]
MTQTDPNIDDMEAEDMAAALLEAVQNGATLKDLHGLSQNLMDGIYAFAYRFYEQGRLDDAEVFFRFLCIYDFYNAEYAMGLAAICQLKKEYAKAIDLYALAYSLSKDDYRPMFHTGQCHLQMGQAALARRCFGVVAEQARDDRLRQKAESYLAGLDEVSAPPDAAPASAGVDN